MTSSEDLLQRLQGSERGRRWLIVVAFVLPWVLVLAFQILRWHKAASWLSPLLSAGLMVLLAINGWRAWRSANAVDTGWLSRRIDDRRRDLEDSAELLFQSDRALPALARLQRSRLQQRLQAAPLADLRTPWPTRALLANALLAMALLALAALWNGVLPRAERVADPAGVERTDRPQSRISRTQLEVQAPNYTGLPAQRLEALKAKVAEGSTLRWALRFEPKPDAVELVFHDGTRLPLQRRGEDWIGSRQLGKSTFYRLQLKSALPLADAGPHRIDVVADRPPQIRVIQPDRSLVVLARKQAAWPLAFQASDDFGLGAAQLRITLAQGSGENIAVSARTLSLSGQGTARQRSYRHQLDLGALGFAVGDDLVVRLSISDNRSPSPQTARSASFILRWPAEAMAEATGVDVLIKKTLPAYFRSQRQIIIDSEALLAERRKLSADKYLERADEIGVDQRILRLRYGQFLGQETSEAPRPPPSASAETEHEEGEAAHADETGAHAAANANAAPTSSEAILETFGHTHDQPEAATLLDRDTRELLKSALDHMWQAELNLRQGLVEQALPHEYGALRYIKQIQQASRIYLARVGAELPTIDHSRRLSGDRKGLQSRRDALKAAQIEASPTLALWQALDAGSADAASEELDGFERWLRAHESTLPDALDLFAALDEVRREPGCADCAMRLRNRLWLLLPARAPVIDSRRAPDRSGRSYLESLESGSGS